MPVRKDQERPLLHRGPGNLVQRHREVGFRTNRSPGNDRTAPEPASAESAFTAACHLPHLRKLLRPHRYVLLRMRCEGCRLRSRKRGQRCSRNLLLPEMFRTLRRRRRLLHELRRTPCKRAARSRTRIHGGPRHRTRACICARTRGRTPAHTRTRTGTQLRPHPRRGR